MKDFTGVRPGDRLLLLDLGPDKPWTVQRLYNTFVTVKAIQRSKIGSYYFVTLEECPREAFQASCFNLGFKGGNPICRTEEFRPASDKEFALFIGI